jgi:hypothetical protein
MPYVNCPCGAQVLVTRNAKRWRPEQGTSFFAHCAELHNALKATGRVIRTEFECERLVQLISASMHSGG